MEQVFSALQRPPIDEHHQQQQQQNIMKQAHRKMLSRWSAKGHNAHCFAREKKKGAPSATKSPKSTKDRRRQATKLNREKLAKRNARHMNTSLANKINEKCETINMRLSFMFSYLLLRTTRTRARTPKRTHNQEMKTTTPARCNRVGDVQFLSEIFQIWSDEFQLLCRFIPFLLLLLLFAIDSCIRWMVFVVGVYACARVCVCCAMHFCPCAN